MDRRSFVRNATATFALTAGCTAAEAADTHSQNQSRIKVVAFDGFPVIDPRPISTEAERLFPGKAEALLNAWRTRQFEYTWLRTLSGHYADFWQSTRDALIFAAQSVSLPISDDACERLMKTYLELKAWPDARAALESLRSAGIRLVFLSNFTARMLDAAINNSGLHGFFEPHLSTDSVHAYKPDPRAYAMALSAFEAKREEVVFCASAGWDAAGAKWFGYPTFWVNRSNQPVEQLGVRPDGIGSTMANLPEFVFRAGANDEERRSSGVG